MMKYWHNFKSFSPVFSFILWSKKPIPLLKVMSFSFYTLAFLTTTDDNRTAQIVRIIRMFYIISTNPIGVSINELVSQFGVCERTIYRDLDRMEYAGIPIVREDHRIKLVESDATRCLVNKVNKSMSNEEITLKLKPGKMYDVARALITSINSIESIKPRHVEKWIQTEANRSKLYL